MVIGGYYRDMDGVTEAQARRRRPGKSVIPKVPRMSTEDRALGHKLVNLVASGSTLLKASESLNVKWEKAHRLFTRTLAEIASERTKQEILNSELVTLNNLQQAQMRKALAGDPYSARTVLHIMDRRAKLLGLDEALRIEVSATQVNQAVREITEIIEGEVEGAVTPLRRAR